MPTTPEAQVCNLALMRVGQREFIDSLDEATVQAEMCSAAFGPARDELLERAPWPFAMRRALLGQLVAPTTGPDFGEWAYRYSLPSDCVAPRFIYTGSTMTPPDKRIPFVIELDSDTGANFLLLTNQPSAQLAYTAQVTNPGLWSPMFVQAMAWRVALDLILSLPVKPQLARQVEDKANRAIAAALASQLNQAQEGLVPEAESIRVR